MTFEPGDTKTLTPQQIREAIALYLHLLNHPEVITAPNNPGMPICKICKKTAKDLVEWIES